jgi:uncharacterized protein YjbI with pentapeptide repeats
MKIIKPLHLGFLWRTYQRQGSRLSVTGMLAFPFSDPDVPLGEQEMWKSIAPLIPPDSAWDEGVPKDRGEFLLMGDCHVPRGIQASHHRVSVRVGTLTKTVDVYGNRTWTRDRGFLRSTAPETFSTMPIDYAHAFGGTGYGPNPTGMGFVDPSDGSPRPLPNIEDSLRPLSSPDDHPEPAGFGPLGLTWTTRNSRVGQYRSDELGGKEPPPLPANTDWTLFNQAPADQWLPGFWTGGEAFSLSGFHPDTETQEGHLPRMVLRIILTFKDGRTAEIPLRPETVWFFPGLSMGVIIHRGSLPIESNDGSEVESILLGAEDPGENRSLEYYLSIRDRRSGRNPKDLSRLGDAHLLPGRLADDPRANLLDIQKIMDRPRDSSQARSQKLISQKLDKLQAQIDKIRESLTALPDPPPGSSAQDSAINARKASLDTMEQKLQAAREQLVKPPEKSTVEDLKEMRKKVPSWEEIKKQAEEKIRAAIDKIPQEDLDRKGITRESLVKSKLRIEAPQKDSLKTTFDPSRVQEVLLSARNSIQSGSSAGTSVPPKISEAIERLDAAGESLSSASQKINDSALKPKSGGIIRILHQLAPPEPDPGKSQTLRRLVETDASRNRNFQNMNLRGADLSGLNLSGAVFSEADLIGANFSGANLSGAQFSGAWAAHANFSGCTLDKTDFSGASLGCADLTGVRGQGVFFNRAVLSGAVLTDSNLSEADFSEADLFHTLFRRSRIKKGQFLKAKFLRAGSLAYPHPEGLSTQKNSIARLPFEDCDFSGSDFSRTLFMKVDFIRSVLAGCRLDHATFLECTGPGTRFDGASLKKSTFPKSTDFKHSTFLKADLSEANLRGLDLEGSDFREACLVGMDGSEGIFRTTNLSGATAQKSRFQKSDLRFANGQGGDFRRALFLKSDLRGANFSHSSLYKAGFIGAQIDATTLWDHALTGKTTLSMERPL